MKPSRKISIKLEQRLFEYACLIQTAVMGFLSVQGYLRTGLGYLTLVDISLCTMGGLFYYLSHYKDLFEKLRTFQIGILFLVIILYWLSLNGVYGTASLGALAVGITSVIISKPSQSRYYLISSLVIIGALILIQITTDWIDNTYKPSTVPTNYFIFLVAILFIIHYVKSEYDKERLNSTHQNRKQQQLNEKLKQSIEEKQAIINQFNQAKDQLVESEKMASVGRLTAGLAHELNNPLNFVGGNIRPIWEDMEELRTHLDAEQRAKTQPIFDEISELLSNVHEGSRRASNIIDNLLKISPRAGHDKVALLDLSDMLRRTLLLFKNVYSKVEIHLETVHKVSFPGNSVEINQVFLNLIKNAVDATKGKKKRRIRIELKKENEHAIILISDNGQGISPDIATKIFEPFFTTKSEGEGTGLGLYISYGIIKKHGGEITHVPQPKGACFRISLPLQIKQNED